MAYGVAIVRAISSYLAAGLDAQSFSFLPFFHLIDYKQGRFQRFAKTERLQGEERKVAEIEAGGYKQNNDAEKLLY